MKARIFLPLAFLPFVLAGCGEHGGIGADSSSKRALSTSTESKIDANREVKRSTNAKATISMPALALMMQALRSYASGASARSTDPHVLAAREIIAVARPVLAWQVDCFGCSAQAAWARRQAAHVRFANLVLSETVQNLP